MTESHAVPIEKADKQSNERLKVIGKVCLYSANIAKSMVNTHFLYLIFIEYSVFLCRIVSVSNGLSRLQHLPSIHRRMPFTVRKVADLSQYKRHVYIEQTPSVPDTNADLSIE